MSERVARRNLAPPSGFEGGSVNPAVANACPTPPSSRRMSEVGRAHASGNSAHITDGGTRPPLRVGWSQPAAMTAGSSSATIARRAAEGPQQLHFFGEPVWPAPRSTLPPRPFAGPHSLSERGRGDAAGHFRCGSSMALQDEGRPGAVRPAAPVKRQAAGHALVGSAVMPLYASGEGPALSTRGRPGSSAM